MNFNNIFLLIQKYKIYILLFFLTIINIYYFSFGYLLTADDVSTNAQVINSMNIFPNILNLAIQQGRIGHLVHGPTTYLAAYLQTNYLFRLIFTFLWFFMLFLFSKWAEIISGINISTVNYFFLLIFQVLTYNHMPPNSYPLLLSLPFILILISRIYVLRYNKNILISYIVQVYWMLFEYCIIFNTALIVIEYIITHHNNKRKKYLKYDIYSVLIAIILILLWRWQYPQASDGVQIATHLNVYYIIKTAIVYATGGISLFYKIDFSLLNLKSYFLLFIYLIIIYCMTIEMYKKNYDIKINYKGVLNIAMVFILFGIACAFPSALTNKHQQWVVSYGVKAYVISRVSYLFIVTGITFFILTIPKNNFLKYLTTFFFLTIASYSFLHNYIMAYDMKDYCSAWERAEALAVFSGSPDPKLNISYFCDPKQRISMHPNFDRNKYWIDFIKWKSFHNEVKIPLNLSLIQKHGLIVLFAKGMDFTNAITSPLLHSINGLSGQEPWGRWSDANIAPTIIFEFVDILPDIFMLSLKANAFGPNVGKDLTVKIGEQKFCVLIPNDGPFDIELPVNLNAQKINTVEFIPPKPTSPKELGISVDDRKLGIGFISMKIIPVGDEMK